MNRNDVGSGGRIERLIYFLVGLFLAGMGTLFGWLCYQWAAATIHFDYRFVYIGISGGLAFFMLRGAWMALLPKKETTRVELSSGGR